VADTFRSLYPDSTQVWAPPRPDRLAAYLPNLATALNNLATRLGAVGTVTEAQAVRSELDELTRGRLGATRPREHGRQAARSGPAWRAWLRSRAGP